MVLIYALLLFSSNRVCALGASEGFDGMCSAASNGLCACRGTATILSTAVPAADRVAADGR